MSPGSASITAGLAPGSGSRLGVGGVEVEHHAALVDLAILKFGVGE